MLQRKPIQRSSALRGRAGLIIINQHLHGDFIYKAFSPVGGVSREALGWPSRFLAGRSPPALGWFHPPSKFTIVMAYGVNKGPFMQ